MLGLAFYDYVWEAILLTITFLGPLLIKGSLVEAILYSLPFILVLGFVDYRETKRLLYYDRVYLGFDSE